MTLLGSQLLIKIDLKTEDFIQEWREYKKMEWLEKQRKKGIETDLENFYNRERAGEILEWEQEIIGDKDKIFNEIAQIIKNKEIIEEISTKTEEYVTSLSKNADYSITEHPREREREKRRKFREAERQKQYEKLLSEWKEKEKEREKEVIREKEREIEKQKLKQKLIEKDLAYDPSAEKKRRKKEPEQYKKAIEERRRYIEKEKEEDEIERKKEEEMARLEELRRLQEEEERKKRKEWEERNAFVATEENTNIQTNQPEENKVAAEISVVTNAEPMPAKHEDNPMISKEENEQNNNEDSKIPAPEMPKLNESTMQAISKIAEETKAKSLEEENEKNKAEKILEKIEKDEKVRKEIELAKQLYANIPKKKNDLYKYPLNWEIVEKYDLIEKKLRPYVSKKIHDYLHQEELGIVNLILKKVKSKNPPQEIEDKIAMVLENETEDFVVKMWKILVFEQLKIENGIIPAQ